MRKTSLTQQPKIVTSLSRTGDSETKSLIKQIQEMQGVAITVQDEKGGSIPLRLKDGVLEYHKGGTWNRIAGTSSGGSSSGSSDLRRFSSGGSSSGGSGYSAVSLDGKVNVSATDGLRQYLVDKITAGTGIEATLNVSGNIETLALSVDTGEIMTIVLANDGSGSGLDADKLDGVEGSAYALKSDLHAAVTVSDSNTLDLSLSGQQVSGDVRTQMSVSSDSSGLKLSGDSGSPGNTKLYGTNSGGTKGWYDQPSAGSSVASGISTTVTNFGKCLSSADTTVQAALDTIDDYQAFKLSRFNPQWLLEETFDRLISGTLDSKTATPASVTRTFGNASTDNNGIATWSGGGWTSVSGARYTRNAGEYVEFVIRTDGTNNIVLNRGTSWSYAYDTAVQVKLDGVVYGSPTPWNQNTTSTYTLSAVAAGVHTIRLTAVNAYDEAGGDVNDWVMAIKSVQYSQLPYQGVGVTGDVAQILYVPPCIWITTVSIGAVDNGATYTRGRRGEGIINRLPLGTIFSDKDFFRSSCTPAGSTMTIGNGILRSTIVGENTSASTSPSLTIFKPGLSITLSDTSGTRGRLITCQDFPASYGFDLAGSIYYLSTLPMIARIIPAESGSAFSPGDVAMMVVTNSIISSYAGIAISTTTSSARCGDLFKIPSGLL